VDEAVAVVVDAVVADLHGAGVHGGIAVVAVPAAAGVGRVAVTVEILGLVDAGAGVLVADVARAGEAVVAGHGRAGDAARRHVAELVAVAEDAVGAGRVIRRVDAAAHRLVARVARAVDPVVAIRRGRRLAAAVDADLRAVADEAVVTVGVGLAGVADAAVAHLAALTVAAARVVGLEGAAAAVLLRAGV